MNWWSIANKAGLGIATVKRFFAGGNSSISTVEKIAVNGGVKMGNMMHVYTPIHYCHLNQFLMTILRSIILNILHLNGAKSIQEQLINNRWDLDDSIAQLLKFSF